MIACVLHADVPRRTVWLYAGAMILLYLFLAVHTPVHVMMHARHDDTWFIKIGSYLADGRWLGHYDQLTLMKGPGYPAFLALNNWLGTPISFSQALLHCAAVIFFVWVAHRFMRSMVLSGLLFTLLLWHPASLSMPLVRILRDRIYFDQLLIVLGLLVLALFGSVSRKQRWGLAALAGLALGWFWLTREEGVWILPGVAIMVLAGVLCAYRDRELRAFGISIATVICVFAATQLSFRAMNWWYYGSFVGVDFKEANFQRALGALSSVRTGGTKAYVSITTEAMRHVYEVSPTFASLAPFFETAPQRYRWGCIFYPQTCGNIGAGWFMWALRDAAYKHGHYASPAEASLFFGKIADEIEAACGRGALQCRRQPIAEMPPLTWKRLAEGLRDNYRGALRILLLPEFTRSFPQSNDDKEAFLNALAFLNFPMHTASRDKSARIATAGVAAGWIGTMVFTVYNFFYLPILALGGGAFLIATLLYWRDALGNVCYAMALTCWTLAATRAVLLLLIAATSFTSLNTKYMAPAYFTLICGAVFSCAAWLQLSRPPAGCIGLEAEPRKT